MSGILESRNAPNFSSIPLASLRKEKWIIWRGEINNEMALLPGEWVFINNATTSAINESSWRNTKSFQWSSLRRTFHRFLLLCIKMETKKMRNEVLFDDTRQGIKQKILFTPPTRMHLTPSDNLHQQRWWESSHRSCSLVLMLLNRLRECQSESSLCKCFNIILDIQSLFPFKISCHHLTHFRYFARPRCSRRCTLMRKIMKISRIWFTVRWKKLRGEHSAI